MSTASQLWRIVKTVIVYLFFHPKPNGIRLRPCMLLALGLICRILIGREQFLKYTKDKVRLKCNIIG